MGKPILFLRLEGPLQAWGTRARWDVRDTQMEPTKSGVVGLLGCALGYSRDDLRLEQELSAGLRFGVRIENAGRVMEDFHTVTDFLPMAEGGYKLSGSKKASTLASIRGNPEATPATILSPRYYLEDAAFLVALEEVEGFSGLVERCATAIQQPVYPLFLGRKACIPSRPIFDGLKDEFDDLEQALKKYPWSWLGMNAQNRSEPTRNLVAYVEHPEGTYVRQDMMMINPARVYGFRNAHRLPPIRFDELMKGEM